MKIRKAKTDDVEKINILNKEWYEEEISPFLEKDSIEKIKEDIKENNVFIAEGKKNNNIISYAAVKVNKIDCDVKEYGLKKNQKYASIESIYVSKKNMQQVNKDVKTIIINADNKEINKLINFYKKKTRL